MKAYPLRGWADDSVRFQQKDTADEDEGNMEKNYRSYSERQGSKDYPAICVLVAALVALFVTGYFSLKVITEDRAFSRFVAAPEWLKGIDKYGDALLDKLIRGKESRTSKTPGAQYHIRLGHRQYRNKNFQEALKEYEKAVKADPGNAEAHYWRGRARLNTGRFDPAAEDFKTVVKLKPDFSEAYDNLGWLSARQGDYDEGIFYLTKSLELKPQNAWAHYNRGNMLLKRGDTENALEDFEKACKLGFQEGCKAYEEFKNQGGAKEGG
jgi:tetratricopeptide (TPR) repeat protein